MLRDGTKERWPFSKMRVGETVIIMGEKGERAAEVCKAKGKRFTRGKFYRGMGLADYGWRFTRIS